MKNVHVFVLVFLCAVTMLIFQIKRIISSEKWCNYVVTFFKKMPKIWVDRMTVYGEKKEDGLTLFCAWQNLLIHCYNQYQNHRNHTFYWKDGRYESWHKYTAKRGYWNCVSQSIWKFLQRQPISTHYLPEILRLILKENFSHFNGKHYLLNHGTVMGTKTAVLISLPIFSWHILKQQL